MGTKTFQDYTNDVLKAFNEVTLDTQADFDDAVGFPSYAKDKINSAIFDICTDQQFKWPFLLTAGSLTLTAGDETESKPAAMADADWTSFYIDYNGALASPYSQKLYDIPIDLYETMYLEGTKDITESSQYSKPSFVARTRDNNFIFGPGLPDAAYTVKYKYYAYPTRLVEYNDVTEIPDGWQEVILARALFYLFTFRDNSENAAFYAEVYQQKLDDMRRVLIPQADTMRTI